MSPSAARSPYLDRRLALQAERLAGSRKRNGLNPDMCEHLQISTDCHRPGKPVRLFVGHHLRHGSLRKRMVPIRKQTPQASRPPRHQVSSEQARSIRGWRLSLIAENCLLSDTPHRSGKPARYFVPDRHSSKLDNASLALRALQARHVPSTPHHPKELSFAHTPHRPSKPVRYSVSDPLRSFKSGAVHKHRLVQAGRP